MEGDLEPPPIHGEFQQVKIQKVKACAMQLIFMQIESSRLGIMLKTNAIALAALHVQALKKKDNQR